MMRQTDYRTRAILIALAVVFSGETVWAQASEAPVGLVLAGGSEARLFRRGARQPVPARAGEMLFAGDRLLAGKNPVSYLYCPSRSQQTLAQNTDALFEATQVRIQKGKLASEKQIAVCSLPPVVNLALASQQQVGALVMRGRLDLQLLSPVGGPLLDTTPRFAWQAVKDADSYEIEVSNAARTVLWKTQLTATEAPYPPHAPPLLVPATYYWRATALAAGKPIAATESSFQLLTTAARQKIRQELADISAGTAENPADATARLAKAVVLERANVLSAALTEYRALSAAWKDAAWLEPKLRELEEKLLAAQRNVTSSP